MNRRTVCAFNSEDLDNVGVVYDPNLTPVATSVFLITVDGEQLDLTFFPEEVGGEPIYIRNRNFVGIREGLLAASFKQFCGRPVNLSPKPFALN